MTEQLSALAVQNAELLRAIDNGPHATLTDLAVAADTLPGNINRKLTALLADGLIAKTGPESWAVELTPVARRALVAIAAFHGDLAQLDLDPDQIEPNPFQPRIVADPLADTEMAASVADKGILQRVLVRRLPDAADGSPRYQQALGHRRVRAAKACGIRVPCEVRALSDDDMAEIGVIENVQRSNLHWMDEAEAYLMLANRGRSAAQIQRLCGGEGRKKRSIQEFIQFARELDEAAKARCRLPEGDPTRLSIDQARALVGNKRARPAIELTPKLACALLELLLAGDCAGGEVGDVIETTLHARPVGGPLITLSDRQLIKLKASGGLPVAAIPITEELARYLAETGYNDDPVACVGEARAKIIGELAAGVLNVEARYLTSELNPPERPEPKAAEPDREEDYDDGGRYAFGQKYAQGPAPEPAAPSAPAAPSLPEISDDAALVVLELAHKIYSGDQAGEALPSTPVDPSYRADPLSNQLVFDRMVMFRMLGAVTAAALTPTAQAWLDSRAIQRDEAGRPEIDDVALSYIQAADGREPRGGYITPWLVVKPPAAPAAAETAHAVRDPTSPQRDSFMEQVLDVARETGADPMAAAILVESGAAPIAKLVATTRRLMAAAREARHLVEAGRSRKLKPEESRNCLALLDAALGDCERDLEQPQNPEQGE